MALLSCRTSHTNTELAAPKTARDTVTHTVPLFRATDSLLELF